MENIEVNGLNIAYRKAGSGPALVLLHGVSIDSRVWEPQLEGLSKDFTVIAWDAPGAGQSSDPPANVVFTDWADYLAEFLDAIGIEKAHILGLSWGGTLAQEFYHRHPHKVVSLILADTYAGWEGSLGREVAESRLEAALKDSHLPAEEFVKIYLPGMFGDAPPSEAREKLAAIMAEFRPAGYRTMALTFYDTDTRSFLPGIKVPTLLVYGDQDKRSPLPVASHLQSMIPGSRLEIIPGAGHVSNLEAPERFNAIVREFCLSVTADGGDTSAEAGGALMMPAVTTGEGRPLILVPGGLTGWTSWEPHAKILSGSRKVTRVQLISVKWGLENKPLPAGYSIRTESEALKTTLDSLGYTAPVDVVGWSYGAFTSLQFALDHPGRIRTLTLIEPPAMWVLRENGKFDDQTREEAEFFRSLHGDITEEMLAGFLQHAGFTAPGQSPKDLPQWNYWLPFRQSLRNSLAVVNCQEDRGKLRKLDVPTLLVKGTGSAPWLHRVIDTLAANIPGSRVVEFPGGHAPHIVSMNAFMEELERFQKNPSK